MTVHLRTKEAGLRLPRAAHFLFGGSYFQMRKRLDVLAPVATAALGSEILTDPGLEATYTAGKCDSLGSGGTPTLAESADVRGGTKAQSFIATATNDRVMYNLTGVAGAWYQASAWAKRTAGAVGLDRVRLAQQDGSNATWAGYITAATYTQYVITNRAAATTLMVQLFAGVNSFDTIILDDMSAKRLTLSSLLTGGGDAGVKYGLFDFDVTVASGYQAGGLCCLDSAASPLYYLHGYVDPSQAKAFLLKVENGTTTELIGAAVTYAAASTLRVMSVPGSNGLSNAQVSLYYAGAKVGTTQTVNLSSGYGTLVRGFDTSGAATVQVRVYGGM